MKLIDVFPYGTGFVLVFEYMLSDLSEVLRNSARPLTEVCSAFDLDSFNILCIRSYMYIQLAFFKEVTNIKFVSAMLLTSCS